MKNRIRELRDNKKMTLDDLSKVTGIKRGTLNNYELGKTEPKLATWQKLADYFNVDVTYLQGINKPIFSNFDEAKEYIKKLLLQSFEYIAKNPSDDYLKLLEQDNLIMPKRYFDSKTSYENDYIHRFNIQFLSSFEFLYHTNQHFNSTEEYFKELSHFYDINEKNFLLSLEITPGSDLRGYYDFMSREEFNSLVFSNAIKFYKTLPLKKYLEKNSKVRDDFLNGLHEYIYDFIKNDNNLNAIKDFQEKNEITLAFEDVESITYENFGAQFDDVTGEYYFNN